MIIDGLEIDFPRGNFTIIDDKTNCNFFEYFSGIFNNYGVMDCSWLDNDTLWLLELKKYYEPENEKFVIPELEDKKIRNEKIEILLRKSVGTLLLLNERYETINCFAKGVNSSTKINLVHILKLKSKHKIYLESIQTKLKTRFRNFNLIFKINSIIVIDYDKKEEYLFKQTK